MQWPLGDGTSPRTMCAVSVKCISTAPVRLASILAMTAACVCLHEPFTLMIRQLIMSHECSIWKMRAQLPHGENVTVQIESRDGRLTGSSTAF